MALFLLQGLASTVLPTRHVFVLKFAVVCTLLQSSFFIGNLCFKSLASVMGKFLFTSISTGYWPCTVLLSGYCGFLNSSLFSS